MNIPFYQVDAFTHQPFKGNPAAICLLDTPISDTLMQAIAVENNLAETAFLIFNPSVQRESTFGLKMANDGPSGNRPLAGFLPRSEEYSLRWFSPKKEMPLCGHATLATAHILWQTGREPHDKPLRFHTLSGILTATRQDDWIELDFPARNNEHRPIPEELEQLFPGGYLDIVYSVDRYMVELPSAAAVRAFTPDAPFLQQHRLVITSRTEKDSPYDFISRYFAHPVGVPEDPVTGTAHCSLATYWAQRLNKTTFFAYQASPRGGELKISLRGHRVSLSGEAVTVIEGTIDI
ncbi:MAG TPA: PhzF family phenazine biosynthesis protein [Puia sp.]|nr:PhzF family phenazine biosynthesis protein [Puia sp.]